MRQADNRDTALIARLTHAVGKSDFDDHLGQFLAAMLPHEDRVRIRYTRWAEPVSMTRRRVEQPLNQVVEAYLRGHYLLDPFTTLATQSERTGLFHLNELLHGPLCQSAYFRQFYHGAGISDEVGLVCRPAPGICEITSLFHCAEGSRFSAARLARLRALTPVINALCELHYRSTAKPPEAGPASPVSVLASMGFDLSRREMQIVGLMLRGHSSLSISLECGITEGTVKIHRKNIYQKLAISSQAELFGLVLSRVFPADD